MLEPRNARERRRFLRLRKEVDTFMDFVKQLNWQVLEGTWEETERTKANLRKAVERIAAEAGQVHEAF